MKLRVQRHEARAFTAPVPAWPVKCEVRGFNECGFATHPGVTYHSAMPGPHDDPAALKALQDEIYRQKVLRARGMTVQERLTEVFEQSHLQFGMMLAGAMDRLATRDEESGWQEVRRWMDRLDRVRDHGLYAARKPDGP